MNIPPGRVLADRYRFISLIPLQNRDATAWRAMDLAFNEEVVVYLLSTDLTPSAEQAAAFEAAFARASFAPRTGTVRWHALDLNSGLAVRDWVNGFTLHEFLRHRRKISVSETLSLLDHLPETLDAMRASDVISPGDLLRECWVAFEPGSSVSGLLDQRPSDWPRNHTRLTVLRLQDFWHRGGETTVQITSPPPIDSKTVWFRLARLICEVLGGRIRNETWKPLSSLNEKANELLRETLEGKEWKSACDLWRAFEASAAESKSRIEAIRPARNPRAFLVPSGPRPTPCRVAALIPREKGKPAIHLCAGSEFRFGRSSSLTEFPTIIEPETPENDQLTGEISRVHARLETRDGALWLRNGNGEAASRNGAQWDGVALPGDAPVALRGRGVLNLANQYKLALTPVAADAPAVVIDGKKAAYPFLGPWGAVIPTPMQGSGFVRRAVWVLTALEFGLDKDGDIQWLEGDYFEPSGIFVRIENGFWLANVKFPPETLRLNDGETPQGLAVPLLDGQSLQIGERIYKVSARQIERT